MYTEEVPIYIPINQLHRGGKTVYTEEVPIYIPINQLHRGGKTVYTEEVPIYTNQSITQRRTLSYLLSVID
jgi:hypothetical protein